MIHDSRFRIHDSRFRIHDVGFTLIEMVIVLGIFTIAATAATSIFLSANKATRRTLALTRSGTDARFVMEKMVEDIRLGAIDYSGYAGGTVGTPTEQLLLQTIDGQSLGYSLVRDSRVCGASGIACIGFSSDGGTTVNRLTAPSTHVRRLHFYVWPDADPFRDGAAVRGQPRVTILFETETVGEKQEERAHLTLQTTVSTRVYKR